MKDKLYPIDPKKFQGLTINLHRNGIEFKTKNNRKAIIQDTDNPDKAILKLTVLLPEEVLKNMPKGQNITSSETIERGVLTTQIGLTTSSLQLIHLLIGEHLKKVGVEHLRIGEHITPDKNIERFE